MVHSNDKNDDLLSCFTGYCSGFAVIHVQHLLLLCSVMLWLTNSTFSYIQCCWLWKCKFILHISWTKNISISIQKLTSAMSWWLRSSSPLMTSSSWLKSSYFSRVSILQLLQSTDVKISDVFPLLLSPFPSKRKKKKKKKRDAYRGKRRTHFRISAKGVMIKARPQKTCCSTGSFENGCTL